MIRNTFKKSDIEPLLQRSHPETAKSKEQEMICTTQDKLLRQEIFTAIKRLKPSKIRSMDKEFERILNRYQ